MKAQIVDKVWRVLFIFIFVLGTAWTPTSSVRAEEANLIRLRILPNLSLPRTLMLFLRRV
jgi:hypothetical protein